jgi:hypothetical protein
MLTPNDIDHILNARKGKAITGKYAITRSGERVKLDGPATGAFDSKQGSKRRSRKGRVWTLPNGYARYIGQPVTTTEHDTDVVAYKR